ncbi:hypothetical protein BLA60_31015 [Actinophytocola xinjiangensis]|uniref:OmpR/PhoB-type domain-containing protein n=1 Tax=Actinophytocola xinjiangensis TaxID=485602 RepID=A0A7Z0WGK3_9PSEU|nr:hypothetical protein BLA60_31015 [Actinophytocola xinjiangensis]
MLGPLTAWTGDGTPVTVPEVKVRLLLALLLGEQGRPVPVDRLVEALWSTAPPADPPAVLRGKVSQLRRALAVEPGGRELVVWRPPGYALVGADTDAGWFALLVEQARAGADAAERGALLGEALALWRGPAFAEFADEPALRETVARLEDQRLAATEEYAAAELALGRHEHLVGPLADVVGRHPLREQSRAAYMRVLYRAGRPGDALATYQDLRERLASELGADPSPELAALHRAILRHDPSLAPARPAHGALPVPLTEIVGRDEDVAATGALLDAGRLVTLTGPGGVGKTRLAIAVAGTLANDVRLVELATLDHPARSERPVGVDDVAALVATALGVDAAPAGPPVPVVERVVAAVRERAVVLVLDNAEHVVGPVAELAAHLLGAAARLRILATSREPLRIAGERVRAVGPLAPDAARRLFTARATEAGYTGDRNEDGVATICRELDGIPLALELAAARVPSLGVGEVARRLDARFRLLSTGRGPARQQTLRAVIDWSWELLTEAEQVVLRRLAVFVGGCTIDAAEAVCGSEVGGESTVDLLGRLVDRCVVVARDGRFTLSRSVAAYCAERLAEGGELAELERRHDAYLTALAERADPGLRGAEQGRWLRLLDAETANLRVALRRATDDRLGEALTWYWFLRGRFEHGHHAPPAARAAFAVLTGASRHDDPGPLTCRQRWFLGACLFGVDGPASERLVAEALAQARAGGDRWVTAAALNTTAWHAQTRGDLAAARAAASGSLAAFEDLGDQWGQLLAAETLASLAESAGEYERAAALYRRGLGIAERLGFLGEIPFKLCGLASVHAATGEYDRAAELYDRAAGLAAERSVRLGETYARLGLGEVALRAGRLDTARAHLTRVLAGGGHDPEVTVRALVGLGLTEHAAGRPAGTTLARACRVAHASGHPALIARSTQARALVSG